MHETLIKISFINNPVTLFFCFFFSIYSFEFTPQQKQEEVKDQIRLLQSGNKELQLEALRKLSTFGATAADAVPFIIKAIKINDEEIKELAAETLGEVGDTCEESISALIKCFYDENPYLNGKAVISLAKIGDVTIPYLREYIRDPNDNVRWCAAITLGKIIPASKNAIAELIDALKDRNENVKWSSVIALGNLGVNSINAIPYLLKTLSDTDKDIRWASYIAIKKINPGYYFKPPLTSDVVSIIDSGVPLLMNEFHVPGVSIALLRDKKIVFSRNFGVRDSRTYLPVTDETMFEACSMSKPVFAYIVLRLAEQKKIDLDLPLYNYLDEHFYGVDSIYKRITARMVLSHTSGLPNWRKGEEEREGPLPVYFKPGERFSYSGEGFYYLQRVVEKITGTSLEDYAEENLFKISGLKHTSFTWSKDYDSLISCGHDTSGNFLVKSKYTHSSSAYTLYTTTGDYAKFIIEILKTNRTDQYSLSKSYLEQMLQPQVDVLTREPIERPGRAAGLLTYWGLGWAIDSTACGKIYYHSGANRTGFRCYSQYNFNEGSGIVIFTNGLNGNELWTRLIKKIGDF